MIALAVFFAVAGAAHFAFPRYYLAIMPPAVPWPRFWVAFTGLCEIAGGAGVLSERTRAAAAWGLIALLVCVFPANIQMLRQERVRSRAWKVALLWARLPLQAALIYWVYTAAL